MAKRRASTNFLRGRWILAIVVLLAGAGAGVSLAFDQIFPSARVAPARVVTPRPIPSPTPTPPEPTAPPAIARPVVIVEDTALDAAVQRALRRLGTIEQIDSQARVGIVGSTELRWSRRTINVRLTRPAGNAIAALRAEIESAGGSVMAAGPTTAQVGLFRDGVPFVTHSIQLHATPVRGRVVVIFDDAGGSLPDLEYIIALGRPVTVAVLPGLRYSREVAARAQTAGLEVFLHLPIEPEDSSKPMGPGGISTAMTDEEITTTVRTDLAWVPGATGINNHMGSLGTADPRVMRVILAVAKDRGLIFLDSVTTPRSVGTNVARLMQVPTAARDVFIDNENDAEAIRTQFQQLIALAQRRGVAVGIGHAQRITARVLQEMLPIFDHEGIDFVSGSTVVH